MRITYLHPRLDFGDGTARLVASARASLAAGHEVSVVSRRGSCTDALVDTGVALYEGELPTRPWLDLFASGRTRDRVAELAPDLLHAMDASLAPLAAKLAEGLERPYLLEVVRPIDEPLRTASARLQAVVLPCESFVERAVNRGNVPRELLRVVPHGPELGREERPLARTAGSEAPRVVLAIATLDRDHGIDVLIQAAHALSRSGRKLEFLVLGEGPDEDLFRRQLRELELGECFTISAPSLRDLNLALAQADVHVACPRRGCLGWSALQALGQGIPSVVSAISSTFPLVEDKGDGLLVEPGNAVKLAECLGLMLDNPTAARAMGVAARERLGALDRRASFERELGELQLAAASLTPAS